MPNDFFRFKQFTVQQQQCAMKVCTDACLFGAWSAQVIINKKIRTNYILDIGAGTGLLSLMLAQQSNASIIHAVEIDAAAAKQAAANFSASPWKEQLHIFNTTIQSFASTQPCDFIISNPPFFQNDLRSANAARNLALHSSRLSLEELLAAIEIHLSVNGYFAVLLAFHRTQTFEMLAQKEGFYVQQKTIVQQTPVHAYFRSMLLFGREQKEIDETTMSIKNNEGKYTDEFTSLLKNYYLYL